MSTWDEIQNAVKQVPTPVWYVVGGAAVYWWGIRPVLGDIGGVLNPDPSDDQFNEDAPDVLKRPTRDSSKVSSVSKVEAQSIANTLLSAMDRPGTDFETIESTLNPLNGKALQEVYVAFGRKWYDPTLGVQSGAAFSWMGHRELDLFNWLYQELDSGEMATIAPIMQRSGLNFNPPQ